MFRVHIYISPVVISTSPISTSQQHDRDRKSSLSLMELKCPLVLLLYTIFIYLLCCPVLLYLPLLLLLFLSFSFQFIIAKQKILFHCHFERFASQKRKASFIAFSRTSLVNLILILSFLYRCSNISYIGISNLFYIFKLVLFFLVMITRFLLFCQTFAQCRPSDGPHLSLVDNNSTS